MLKLSDSQLLLYCFVFISIVWMFWGMGLCVNDLDQLVYVLFPLSFMAVPVLIDRWKKRNSR